MIYRAQELFNSSKIILTLGFLVQDKFKNNISRNFYGNIGITSASCTSCKRIYL
jgi:hypothetical protein